jgi:hypothetical protein
MCIVTTEVVDVYQAAVLQLQLQVLGHRSQGSSSGPVLAKLNHHLHDFQVCVYVCVCSVLCV